MHEIGIAIGPEMVPEIIEQIVESQTNHFPFADRIEIPHASSKSLIAFLLLQSCIWQLFDSCYVQIKKRPDKGRFQHEFALWQTIILTLTPVFGFVVEGWLCLFLRIWGFVPDRFGLTT
jgi:hypothetical protein